MCEKTGTSGERQKREKEGMLPGGRALSDFSLSEELFIFKHVEVLPFKKSLEKN